MCTKCTFVHAQNKCQGLFVLPSPSHFKTHRINNYNTERFSTSNSGLYRDKWQLCRHTDELQTTEWGAGGEESCTEVNGRQLWSYMKVIDVSVNFLVSQFEVSTSSAISILKATLGFLEIFIHALICTVMQHRKVCLRTTAGHLNHLYKFHEWNYSEQRK